MSESERNGPELKAFEAMLGGLVPAAPALDRDRLMYEAGRASADGAGRRAWPVATLCVGLAALAMGRLTAWPAPSPERQAGDRRPAIAIVAPRTTPSIDDNSWGRLRQSIDGGGLATNGREADLRPASHAPAAATWLDERRKLSEYVN